MINGYRNILWNNQTASNSYVSAPNNGPYNSTQYPNFVSGTNNGMLIGRHPNPAQFPIMNNGGDFSNTRQVYYRIFSKLNTPLARQLPGRYASCQINEICGKNRGSLKSISYPQVNNKNYIAPKSSSEMTHLKRAANIGKSSLKVGLPLNDPLTYKNYDKPFVTSTIKRARSSGCVPPKKCSSIYHREFTRINAFTQNSF